MTGWLITIAYLAGTVLFARAKLRHWHKVSTLIDYDDGGDRTMAALAALGLGLIWPLAAGFQFFARWLWKPVDRDVARREQLRKDRDSWRHRAVTATDEQERATAAAIVETLDDLLRERA